MATTSPSSLFPAQQQQMAGATTNVSEEGKSGGGGSGSIAPFCGVITVLVVLSVLSCVLGRTCARRESCCGGMAEEGPLESIERPRWLQWLRRKWRQCLAREVEAGAKVANFAGGGEGSDDKVVNDVETQRS